MDKLWQDRLARAQARAGRWMQEAVQAAWLLRQTAKTTRELCRELRQAQRRLQATSERAEACWAERP
jgi:hypothetical protein